MQIKPVRDDLLHYVKKRGLTRKFAKQCFLFTTNSRYPSLKTEILEPRRLRLYSFRIDKKYRAIFIMTTPGEAEIIDINDHYQK
jgi:Txe/YoeB family toxin of Txe-Axe toxin-antitoxin module